MRIKIFFVLMLGGLSSCQVYQSCFDSSPCKGVPCRSVTEIEKMITETPDGGPDIFFEKPKDSCSSASCNRSPQTVKNSAGSCRGEKIWVENSWCGGVFVQGHYLYFQNQCEEETIQ